MKGSIADVNFRKIERASRNNVSAREVLRYLAVAGANDFITTVDELLTQPAVKRPQAVQFLQLLADTGCGQFKNGRRGQPTRLEWRKDIDPREVVSAVGLTDDQKIDSGQPLEPTLRHRFNVRPDFPVEFSLPKDLTHIEAERIAAFIKTIPFGEK